MHLHVCVNPGKSGVCLTLRTRLNWQSPLAECWLAEDGVDGVVTEWRERPFPGKSQGEESYVNKSKALWVLKMSILTGDS